MSQLSEQDPPAATGVTPADAAHDDHGNTLAAWTAATIIMVAVVIGAIGILVGNWAVFWIGGIGLVVVGAIVGKVMAMMGYGADAHAGEHPDEH